MVASLPDPDEDPYFAQTDFADAAEEPLLLVLLGVVMLIAYGKTIGARHNAEKWKKITSVGLVVLVLSLLLFALLVGLKSGFVAHILSRTNEEDPRVSRVVSSSGISEKGVAPRPDLDLRTYAGQGNRL